MEERDQHGTNQNLKGGWTAPLTNREKLVIGLFVVSALVTAMAVAFLFGRVEAFIERQDEKLRTLEERSDAIRIEQAYREGYLEALEKMLDDVDWAQFTQPEPPEP